MRASKKESRRGARVKIFPTDSFLGPGLRHDDVAEGAGVLIFMIFDRSAHGVGRMAMPQG